MVDCSGVMARADGLIAMVGPTHMEMRLESDAAQVPRARRALEVFIRRCGLGDATAREVGLCLQEALAHIVAHAYGGDAGRPIFLQGDFRDELLRLTIRDWGNGRHPEFQGAGELECLRLLLNEVRFTPQPDGMLWTLERRRLNLVFDGRPRRIAG